MIKVEESIIINRPVEEVFAFVADQTNAPRWQSGLLEVRRTTEGPLGVGTKHTLVRKFMGQRLEASNEYLEYEPNRWIVFRGTANTMDFEASYLTEPTAEGTRLTSTLDMQSIEPVGLEEASFAEALRRDVEANLSELKDLLETRGVAASARYTAAQLEAEEDPRAGAWNAEVRREAAMDRRRGSSS